MLDSTKPQNEHVLHRLLSEQMIWLSSVRADNRPHLVPVWFLWEEETGTILIFSQPNNQKIRNLRQNPNVVLSLDTASGGGDIVLFEGKAELLPENSFSIANAGAYIKKYAQAIKGMNSTPEGMGQQYTQAIRIAPTRFINWS
jgi:PPOX class probable F420-dependent enzyme